MLSGGARCRQTVRHLATSRLTFGVVRAPAAPNPTRLQPTLPCAPERFAAPAALARRPPRSVRLAGRTPSSTPGIPALRLCCLSGRPGLSNGAFDLSARRTPLLAWRPGAPKARIQTPRVWVPARTAAWEPRAALLSGVSGC